MYILHAHCQTSAPHPYICLMDKFFCIFPFQSRPRDGHGCNRPETYAWKRRFEQFFRHWIYFENRH